MVWYRSVGKENLEEETQMVENNITKNREFILVGFSDVPEWNLMLLIFFIIFYSASLAGNGTLLLLIILDSSLHTPMYLFLGNLSFIDICSMSAIAPQVMDMFGKINYTVSFSRCFSQLYFYLVFIDAEFFLLTVMAYDRYVAICNPLRYHMLMGKGACITLAIAPWAFGFLDFLSYTIITSQLSYCRSHVVNHFFCDLAVLMNLSCSDTSTIELLTFVETIIVGFTPFLLTITSYVYIMISLLKRNSVDGRSKAFSTCLSHMTVVILFYGAIIFMYIRPASEYSHEQDKLYAVFYTTVIPVLNPLIYSLRNRDVKHAFKKMSTVFSRVFSEPDELEADGILSLQALRKQGHIYRWIPQGGLAILKDSRWHKISSIKQGEELLSIWIITSGNFAETPPTLVLTSQE
ncbi:olfactory receptor 5AR1-like [Discoglossus pictus]